MKNLKRKIIIGKNSRISKLLIHEIPDVMQISHTQAYTFDFSNFDEIYFIGWDNRNPSEVLGLLNWIDLKKVIMFSTISVYSNQFRLQWANYPKFKILAEKIVLTGGGKIIRLGRIIDKSNPRPLLTNPSPVTPLELIIEYMHCNTKETIKNLFKIAPGNTGILDRILSKVLHKISCILPNTFLFQAPLVIVAKILNVNSYGYGADAEAFVHNSIQIGFGALGSSYFKKHRSDAVFISTSPNIDLIGSGFGGTLIGRFYKGLGAYWHGVTIKTLPNNKGFTKSVPLIVRRPSPPKNVTHKQDVCRIKYEFDRWQITTFSNDGKFLDHFCNNLVLAAGPIENTRLLSCIAPIKAVFDDHFTFFAGSIKTSDAIENDLVIKLGPIMIRKKILSIVEYDVNYLCDIRPHTNRNNINNDQFYLARTASIVKKLLLKADLLLINEAFFNKFGIAFYTKNCSAYIQLLERNNISVTCNNGSIISIQKAMPDLTKVISSIQSKLPNIVVNSEIKPIDTQHIVGGKSILALDEIKQLCDKDVLKIIGSPTTFRLTAHHHTNELRNHYQ